MRKRIYTPLVRTVWLGLFLLCAIGTVFGQNVTISGKVFDQNTKEPLQGARVTAEQLGGSMTKEDGSFSFAIPQQDKIRVQVTYLGYKSAENIVNLSGKTSVELEFGLAEDIFETDPVTITAAKGLEQKQSDIVVSIEVVKPQSVNLQATANITKALVQIPGVDNLNGQINIRGSSGYSQGVGSRVMVMLDGLPLLLSNTGAPDFKLLPVDNIDQIEVIKGASSVMYGSSALGGVINVRTSEPGEEPLTSIRLKQSVYDSPRNKHLDWDGSSSAYESSFHIFHSRRIGKKLNFTGKIDGVWDSGYMKDNGSREARGMMMWAYKPKHGLSIGLNVSGRIDTSASVLYWSSYLPDTTFATVNDSLVVAEIQGGGLVPDQSSATVFQKDKVIAIDPYVKYVDSTGNLYWYRGRYFQNVKDATAGRSSNNIVVYNDFLYQRAVFEKIEAGEMSWGSGITHTYNYTRGDSVTAGAHDIHNLGIFTQMDAKFVEKININFGFRLEMVQIDDLDWQVAPLFRTGMNYQIRQGTNVRGSFGQAFRAPSISELFVSTAAGGAVVEPNPNLRSEKGYSAELGIRQMFLVKGERGRFFGYADLAAFMMRFDDMIEFGFNEVNLAASDIRLSTRNVANARIRGLEFGTQMTYERGDFVGTLGGGVTFLDPRDLGAVPEENQLRISHWPYANVGEVNLADLFDVTAQLADTTLSDRPEKLKYRNKFMVRFSGSLKYKKIGFTANFRYRSFMEEIDQMAFLILRHLNYFRQLHPSGDKVADFIISYDFTDDVSMNLTIDNAFNEEYMIIAGLMAPQRKFTLQYIHRF